MNERQTRRIIIPSEDANRIHKNAVAACIGGRSNWKIGKDREETRLFDNFIGQAGEYVAAVVVDGDPQGYFERRERINLNRFHGDEGSDLTNRSIDFKTSYMRRSQDPMSYNLLVRPRERHVGWTYVLCLVPDGQIATLTMDGVTLRKPLEVIVVGSCRDEELPSEPYQGSIKVCHGAFLKPANELTPMFKAKTNKAMIA